MDHRPKTPGHERPKTPFDRPKTPGPQSSNTPTYFLVFLRLRPSSAHHPSFTDVRFISPAPAAPGPSSSSSSNSIFISPPDRARTTTGNGGGNGARGTTDKYTFSKVFAESASQREVFTTTALPLVRDAIQLGRDAMLATLGVTGSGKTHTILGNRHQRGIVQLSLDVILSSLAGKLVDCERVDVGAFDRSDGVVRSAPHYFSLLPGGGAGGADLSARAAGLAGLSAVGGSAVLGTGTPPPTEPDVSDLAVDADPKSGYAVLVSMFELYNDRIFDLLDETATPAARRQIGRAHV